MKKNFITSDIKSRTFYVEHPRAAILLEIFNEMRTAYVAVRYTKGFRIQIALTDREVSQLAELDFYALTGV